MAPDGRMFQTGSRKGELFELKQGLNATTMKERKKALKRTVAAMTLGRDVSSLFTDVVKNTAGDLSMKKLVYLYIINYAQANADLSILIVNTFIKDASDQNPLIRALAIRTMALIPLEKITEYLCEPLHAALKDRDPYVRKTAAVCVAKLYDMSPTVAAEEGFIQELQLLLDDGNSMTVANAVAALSEIAESSQDPNIMRLTPTTVPSYLSVLPDCTEWGQIFILDALSSYIPSDPEEADRMIERIVPRLQHANPGVGLSTIRVIVNLMPTLDSDQKREFLIKKMSAPLVTLLTAQPELQFVALRNISILIRDFPALLSSDVKIFFVSYADPLYVKIEKLHVLVSLTDESNADMLLSELVEYAGEVDVTFAQKAVDSIGQIALRLPPLSGRCITILSEILKRKVIHLTEQVAVALKDILREYPRQFNHIVDQICQASEDIEDPPAKAALVWIIGEHADHIPSAVSMLQVISDTIHEETSSVQLQTLTACVKAYITRGPEAQGVLDAAIKYATEESENVDVRDRGLIYKRLVSMGSDSAQRIVLNRTKGVQVSGSNISPELQKELLRSLSSVASVYHKPTRLFKGMKKRSPVGNLIGEMMAEEDLLGLDQTVEEPEERSQPPLALTDGSQASNRHIGDSLLDDILGPQPLGLPAPPHMPPSQPPADLLSDLGMTNLTVSGIATSTRAVLSSKGTKELLPAEKGKGLAVKGSIIQSSSGAPAMELELFNTTQVPMTSFEIQLNKNMFGFSTLTKMEVNKPIQPNTTSTCQIPLQSGGNTDPSKGFVLQTAVRFSPGGVVYFALDAIDSVASLLDRRNGLLSKPTYLSKWKSIPDATEVKASIVMASDAAKSLDWVSKKLGSAGIFTVKKRSSSKPPMMYLSAILIGSSKSIILAELTVPATGSATIASRTTLPSDVGYSALVSFNETCSQLLAL